MTDLKKLIAQAQGKSANDFWLATGRRPTDVIVELVQHLEKLALESAALKIAVDGFNQELYGKGFEVLGWHLNGATEPLDSWFEDNDWNPETPATDAVLAEVEARGVERFAKEYLRETAKEHGAEGNEGMALRFNIFANMAEGFAAHLRNPPYRAKELREVQG
ncbi:conserved hypothetical protein [Enterobacterales bacterium 8AC]|nr:conserved hypothetical protein [Enterobacterales bacterium 8AC]